MGGVSVCRGRGSGNSQSWIVFEELLHERRSGERSVNAALPDQ